MSDHGPQSIVVSHGIAAGAGLLLAKIGHALWKAFERSRSGEINTLREQLAVARADKERLEQTVDKLGKEKDELRTQLETERIRSAGVVARIYQDPKVDDSFAEEMPTAVRERAELFAPRSKPDPHAQWGADPHPARPWEPNATTPPGRQLPPRPRMKSRPGGE